MSRTEKQRKICFMLAGDGGVRSVAESVSVDLLESLTSRAGGEVAAVP